VAPAIVFGALTVMPAPATRVATCATTFDITHSNELPITGDVKAVTIVAADGRVKLYPPVAPVSIVTNPHNTFDAVNVTPKSELAISTGLNVFKKEVAATVGAETLEEAVTSGAEKLVVALMIGATNPEAEIR